MLYHPLDHSDGDAHVRFLHVIAMGLEQILVTTPAKLVFAHSHEVLHLMMRTVCNVMSGFLLGRSLMEVRAFIIFYSSPCVPKGSLLVI
jgi:hypothetical protein